MGGKGNEILRLMGLTRPTGVIGQWADGAGGADEANGPNGADGLRA